MTSKINKKILLLTCLSASVLIFITYEILTNYQFSVVEYDWPMGKNGVRYILYWDKMWFYEDFGLGFGSEIFKNCPVNNCFTTKNRQLIPLEEFDALVFHGVTYLERLYSNPPKRDHKQVYIYFNLESPFNTPVHLKYSYGFFNWTLSYRTDSDIFRPYGRVVEQKNINYTIPTVDEIQKRPKKVAWFVSHCGVPSKRDVLAQKLNQHIPVDIYGKCGDLVCSKDNFGECYDMMEKNYKFYLSFENSVCKDYVTEKLFYVLTKNVIPIVYGGADYDKILPPLSVIDATKFKTVGELADYLKFLDENPDEYLRYFEWKKSYYSDTTPQAALCQLCQKLNEPRKKVFYEDVVAWLNYPGICKSGDELPPIVFS